jgi:hypothetical protein
LADHRAISGVDLELFGALVIGLTLVFAAKFSDVSEQVTDECVGEDSLRVEFLTDLIAGIVNWVESPCFFAAQGQMLAPVQTPTEFLHLAPEAVEQGQRELLPERVGADVADIPSVGRTQHGLVASHAGQSSPKPADASS